MRFSAASGIRTTTKLFNLASTTSSGLTSIASPLGTTLFALKLHIYTHVHAFVNVCISITLVYYTDRCFGFVSLAILYVYTHTSTYTLF